MSRRIRLVWLFANIAWLVGIPLLFGIWLHAEVQAEYALGTRVSGNGDAIAIPVAGVALLNGAILLLLNATIAIVLLLRNWRRRHVTL